MNVKLILFLICCVSRAFCYHTLKSYTDSNINIDEQWFLDDQDIQDTNHGLLSNATLFKTITIFSCFSEYEDAELLVYGTKGWRFPTQDINLTLTYPPPNVRFMNSDVYDEDYVITGFKVLLFVDTMDTKGYINSGGILTNRISLSFVSPNINILSYQFWLYGIPRARSGFIAELIQVNKMC